MQKRPGKKRSRGSDVTSNEDIISVDETPFDDVPESQRPNAAKKWAFVHLKGKTFTNKSTGRQINITANGIGHTVYEVRNREAFYLLPVLPDMIERATHQRTDPPKTTTDGEQVEKDLLAFEIYEIRVKFRGKMYSVSISVKRKKGGTEGRREIEGFRVYRNYYFHETEEK
jgi:hypothetical protein